MRLLCISNGHGEDEIALRILKALQQLPDSPQIAALPIVGEGHAYTKAAIPLIGITKAMPSGGFIYMDSRQLVRDLQGGLLSLTLNQIKAVKAWSRATTSLHPESTFTPPPISPALILAVGDIVPLLFARFSGLPYVFVGTAKSEYYLRDEGGWLPRDSWWSDRFQRTTGCIYHPWERWLMRHPNCKAVFPRDTITTNILKRYGIPALDLGNPMMDGLEWEDPIPAPPHSDPDQDGAAPLTLILLPGSRTPEAYANWEIILHAVNGLLVQMERPLVLLMAVAPALDLAVIHQTIRAFRWQQITPESYMVGTGKRQATLVIAKNRFAEFLHRADLAIAMAGTATEQFVGSGKAAILIPGQGPQFTPAFAESYTRLLGASVTVVPEPAQTAAVIQALLNDPDRLQLIKINGERRMGKPGASHRIAQHLMALFA